MAHGHDLSVFRNTPKKSWDQRAALIKQRFPSTDSLNWKEAFDQDLDLFARIVRDILKVDQAQPGRPGPRPSLDRNQARHRLRQYLGQDYSLEPFAETFAVLGEGLSVRQLARKVGLNQTLVFNLLKGRIEPDAYVMGEVAAAFDKHPSYFLEYRVLYVTNAVMTRLENVPEASVNLYSKLVRPDGGP